MNLKQVSFEEYFLAAVFATVSLLSIVFAGYFAEIYQNEKLSQNYYGSDTLYLKITDPEKRLDYHKLYEGLNNAIIFQELSGERVRGILYRGNVDLPLLQKGRFFNEGDFFQGQKRLVVGSAYDPVIKNLDGRDYIAINNENYEVIGKMSAGQISQLDYLMLVNLDAVDSWKGGIYAVDGKSKREIAEAGTLLKNEVNRAGGSYTLIEREPSGIKRLLQYEQSNTLLFVTLFLVLLLSSIVVSLSLFEKKKCEIAVQRLLGFSSRKILGQLLRSYILLAHIGFVGGLVPGLLLIYLGKFRITSPLVVAASYPVMMFFGLLLITIPAVQALRSQARELLCD